MLFIAAPVLACINTYTGGIKEAHSRRDTSAMAAMVARLEESYAQTPTIESTNDLAVARILMGRVDEGIKLLRDLEQRHPGNAIVAANLGTALELSGNDAEALTWIRESVNRDSDEHDGSEWVHGKILEAKIILKKNPNWLRTRSVVGWREGQQLMADEQGRVRSPADLIKPISYQLKERTQFIQPPDDVVGDLYLTLGDVAHSTSAAYPNLWARDDAESLAYEAALRYGTVHEVRVRERLEAVNRRIEASRPERQAAERRGKKAQADAQLQAEQMLEQKQKATQQREERQHEQTRRRQLAVWMFVALGVVVVAVLGLRARRAAS